MSALTAERDTPSRDGKVFGLGVAAAALIFKGALVVNDGGFAAPAHAAPGLVGLGRAENTVDNSNGAAGAVAVSIERGTFRFGNDIADPVASADIGASAYAVDDQTVAKTSGAGARSAIGTVFAVDADGVWVTI